MFFFNDNKSNLNRNSIQLIKILSMIKVREKKCYCCSHCMFHSTSGNIFARIIMMKNKKRKKNEGIVTYTNWFIQLLKSTSSCNSRQYIYIQFSLIFSFFSSAFSSSILYRIILKSGFDKKNGSIHTYENDNFSIQIV